MFTLSDASRMQSVRSEGLGFQLPALTCWQPSEQGDQVQTSELKPGHVWLKSESFIDVLVT